MHDPVIADLNRHLNAQDREDSRSEEADAIIAEWKRDHIKVSEALVDELEVPCDLFALIIIGYISGNWSRATGWLDDTLTQKWEEAAAQEADRRVAQSWADAAEAQEESRE